MTFVFVMIVVVCSFILAYLFRKLTSIVETKVSSLPAQKQLPVTLAYLAFILICLVVLVILILKILNF